ncbi:MAG: enoyl-CoA hydratase/isomerase family protein [Pseudomonadota bacterium]|nr:enoyl-CoA hydratase/isomerase family protein [Pseudomonadota bacterium]
MAAAPALDIAHPVATLTLRRPENANRLEPDDLKAVVAHLATVNRDPGILVLQIRGEGKYFCSGYDISSLATQSGNPLGFEDMANAVEAASPVTVAVVHGGTYGGGTDLALACDFRIGTHAAEMFMPAARLGLHYYRGGLQRYVTRLGLDTAKRLFMTAERLDAQAMRACGFLTDLVTADELEASVKRLTDTLIAMAPLALLGMKKHMNRIARCALDVDEFNADIARAAASDDIREGAAAWAAKRPPKFTGR